MDGLRSERLAGKVCLVTGSTGIAAAGAERFAADGARVFVVSRTEAHCRGLADRLTTAGHDAGWSAADLTDGSAVDRAVAACLERFGGIDGLFAVAGGSGRGFGDGPIHEVGGDAWASTLDLNARSMALTAGAVIRAMLARSPRPGAGRGSIVLMSSVLASSPAPAHFATHAYAASKGAIAALGRTTAAYYAPHGIRVNVLAPALVTTAMSSRAAEDPRTVAYAAWKQPLAGGFLPADDVAAAAAWLLSDEARYVTGQLLMVDGGWSVTNEPPAS